MPDLDSPHWSWFHGCRKHKGQAAPCQICLGERDPDITQGGQKAFSAPKEEPKDGVDWDAFCDQMAINVARNNPTKRID